MIGRIFEKKKEKQKQKKNDTKKEKKDKKKKERLEQKYVYATFLRFKRRYLVFDEMLILNVYR